MKAEARALITGLVIAVVSWPVALFLVRHGLGVPHAYHRYIVWSENAVWLLLIAFLVWRVIRSRKRPGA